MKDEDWMLDTVEVWAVALTDLKITRKELNLAQRKSMALEWPPTAPADFLTLARTEQASQYPTANEAFNIACSNCGMKGDVDRKWKHEVVYETANRIGWGVLASATDYFLKTFTVTYEQVCAEHASGTSFVIPKSHRLAHSHEPVQAGSAADKKINEQLAAFRRVAV